LVDRIEPRAMALGLNETHTGELYRAALAQANRELGRVSGQLASKNRRLLIRAKFFDALSQFQGELRPDAPAQVVLRAIGQTAVAVLDVEDVAVFSLPPGREYAETTLIDRNGEVFETSLVDTIDSTKPRPLAVDNSPAMPAALYTPNGDGPVLSAGPDRESLLDQA
jgi:hypothetical protein